MMINRSLKSMCALAALLCFCGSVWGETLFFEGFELDSDDPNHLDGNDELLANWLNTGGVITGSTTPAGVGNYAILNDLNREYQYRLYRPLGVTTGTLTLEFDFLDEISDSVNYGFDDAFVGVYFLEDSESLTRFVSENLFDYNLHLLEITTDEGHTVTALNGGTISPVVVDDVPWQRYSITFENLDYEYVVPYFDLANFNGVPESSGSTVPDSSLYIDNIRVSNTAMPVPTPPAVGMAGVGIAGCWIVNRFRRQRNR